jgi:beta-lactamase regulating signal transducer with metallopeptidase domain
MGTFFAYIIKTALFLVVYYLFYKLLLSRETFHRFNRIALVSLLLLSFLLPLMTSLVNIGNTNGEGMITIEDLSTMATAVEDMEISAIPTSHLVIAVLMLVYLLGILVFTVRSLVSYISLARMLRKGERQVLEDGSILCLQDEEVAPFSWMHYIVANRKDLEENGKAILSHELGHIHNHHTLDLILTEVALILQWFNPAIWLMRQELQAIHEYEADEAVLDQGIDAKSYQLLLIKKAAGSRLQSITNSLHQSSIKKRITMMLNDTFETK